MSIITVVKKYSPSDVQLNTTLNDYKNKINELVGEANSSILRSKVSDFWGTPFWSKIPDKPSTYPPSSHEHDDRYYTETELNNGQLNTLYYTETEINDLLAAQNEFKELTDTPVSYVDQGGKGIRVKGAEDGLEFYTPTDLDELTKVGVAGVADYLNESYFERDVDNHIRIKQNTLLSGVDADKVDGEQVADIVTNARVKAHFPDTIANILSNHNLAVHNALGITTLGTVGTGVWQGTPIVNAYVAGIDQNLLQASSPTFIKLTLTQATGIAPLAVSSQTLVSSLNSDLWDNQDCPSLESGKFLTNDGAILKWMEMGAGEYHNLLSVSHPDTVVGTCAQGDIITGQPANILIPSTKDAGLGTDDGADWTGVTNIYASDNVKASVDLADGIASSKILATTFGFTLPANATIQGIRVSIEKQANTTSVKDNSVRIIKGGVISGDQKASADDWSASDAYKNYGSDSDLWGLGWSYSDINASNFGVGISVVKASGFAIAKIDHIRITVHYTTPGYGWTRKAKGTDGQILQLVSGYPAWTGTSGSHTHVKTDITDTPWAWGDVLKTGSNLTDLVTRQHAGLTNILADQHHAQLHASAHHVGGGDLVNHDSLTGFVAAEHKSLPNTIAQVLSDHNLAVHNALGINADTLDTIHAISFALKTRALDTFGATTDITTLNATTAKHGLLMKLGGGTTNFLRADGVWEVPAPGVHASSHLVGAGDTLSVGVPVSIGIALLEGEATNFARRDHVHTHPSGLGVDKHHAQLHAAEHEIGGAGDLVNHDNLSGFVVSEHTSLPNTIAAVLSNHTVAVHDALNINADTLDTLHASSFALTTRKLDDFGTPDDNTDLNASTTRHGLLKKLSGVTANFLRGDGIWANPVLGAHASSHEIGGGEDLVNHNNLSGWTASAHQVLPNTIAVVLNDHNVANHNSLGIDHGSLGGKGDDDHSIYYNLARHTKAIHDALAIDHGSLGGRGDDDHSVYYNAARHTKAIHDALNIDADTVDTYHAASFMKLAGGTFTGYVYARDHGTAATDMIVNVCYGTGDPPAANTTTIGTIYIKYTA